MHCLAENNDKAVIAQGIKMKIFPKVKFFVATTDLEFATETKRICGYLLNEYNVGCMSSAEDEIEHELVLERKRKWWQDYKPFVKAQLSEYRNNKIKCVQMAFNGKCMDGKTATGNWLM